MASAHRLTAITVDKIEDAVAAAGYSGDEADKLTTILDNRRLDIIKRSKQAPAAPTPGAKATSTAATATALPTEHKYKNTAPTPPGTTPIQRAYRRRPRRRRPRPRRSRPTRGMTIRTGTTTCAATSATRRAIMPASR